MSEKTRLSLSTGGHVFEKYYALLQGRREIFSHVSASICSEYSWIE